MTVSLTAKWTEQKMAQAVPGAYWDGDSWVIDTCSPRAAVVALKLFPSLALEHPELLALRDQAIQEVRPFDNATPLGRRIDAPRVQAVLDARGWKLHDYQALDLGYGEALLRRDGGYYMGWERGLGKTLGSCCLLDALDTQAAMIVCPNTAKTTVWADEVRDLCPWLEVLIMPNEKAKREAMLARLKRGIDSPFVLITHYEALAVVSGKGTTRSGGVSLGDGWKKLGIHWDIVVADEGHRLSNPKAQMTRAFKKLPRAKTVLLSGSIIQNELEELFSQLQCLYPDRYRSQWRDWNDRFLDYVENGYGKMMVGVLPGKIDAMRRELGVIMTYRRKQDELDLPERTDVSRYIDLTPGQRKVYTELAEECMSDLEDGTRLKSAFGAGMMTTLRQVATGLDLVGDVADSSKLDFAVEMILDGKDDDFVVFSWYKSAVHELAQRLEAKGVQTFAVTGDVPHARRAEYIKRFQAGEGRVFIGTLSTLGESVNLQRANNVIMLDRSFNPSLNAQAEDRVYRQGQQRRTTITHLIAKDTVDELVVMPNIANKEALRAAVLGATR